MVCSKGTHRHNSKGKVSETQSPVAEAVAECPVANHLYGSIFRCLYMLSQHTISDSALQRVSAFGYPICRRKNTYGRKP